MGIIERKEREKEHRREDIISAAETIFSEKGLLSTTMDEIAEKAELSKGTLYLYYKSKEDLYLAVIMKGNEILYQMFVDATQPGRHVIERLQSLGDAYYRFFREYRRYFRMFQFLESSQFHKQVSEEMLVGCKAKDQRIWNLGMDLVQQAIDEGFIEKDVQPAEAIMILWAISNSIMRQMDRDDNYWKEAMKIDLDQTLRRSYAFILEGMMTKKGKQKYQSMKNVEEVPA